MAKLVRILSIDGGGIRGIIPGQILIHLEQILQERTHNKEARISDFFDLIAGTSTGGILTCLLLCPGEKNSNGLVRPRYSTHEALDFYLKNGPVIFRSPFWYKLISLLGLVKAKYPASGLEEHLEKYFANLCLSELLKPCLITSYNIEKRYAIFFSKLDAAHDNEYNFLVRDVARATSAAPTYFKPAAIKSLRKKVFPLVDGGVFANNPSLCAYTEVCEEFKNHPTAKDMVILSLGTGEDEKPIPYQKAKNWGGLQWAGSIVDVLMSGNSETVDYELKTIYKAANSSGQYLRINPTVPVTLTIDNVKPESLKALTDLGKQSAEKHHKQLQKVAELLIESTFEAEEDGKLRNG